MRISPSVRNAVDSPIGRTYDLLGHRRGARRLLDLAQAAPQYPPAPAVVRALTATAGHPHGADYAEVGGLPMLREEFAADLSAGYRATVRAPEVTVTAGCNQAYCVTLSALTEPGDEVILALPYYFNHDMWLRLHDVVPRYLEPDNHLVPRAVDAAALLTRRTRAIVLVSPGNPTGVTVPPDELRRFAELARRHDVALVIDETYRSFRDTSEPAHELFTDPAWRETVVSLHSFSKDLAIPGYRVGAVVAAPDLGREIEKLLDCVAVCAPRIGQEAARAGLRLAGTWRADRARDLAVVRRSFRAALADRPGGFQTLSVGGFFAWLRHPFRGRPTEHVVRQLAADFDTLVIPGTAFGPDDRRTMRVSLSNLDAATVHEFAGRLALAGRTAGEHDEDVSR